MDAAKRTGRFIGTLIPIQMVAGFVFARTADGVTIVVLYAALYRFALVPRVIAGFGLVAGVLMLSSVGMALLGHDVVFPMLAPLGLSQLALSPWLVAKGFRDQAPRPRALHWFLHSFATFAPHRARING